MKLKIYQIDAFAKKVFEGNPAAVIPLDAWLDDATMQSIAAENNLAETAFLLASETISDGYDYTIRWFTPTTEVTLCGHATLAAAFFLINDLGFSKKEIIFDSLSGLLKVSRSGEQLVLDFPAQKPAPCVVPQALIDGLGITPIECLVNEDYVVRVESETILRAIQPNHEVLKGLDYRCVIVTAVSEQYDFVARVFGPKLGIPEDPVTGSAYTHLAPYWASVLGKDRLSAKQVSARGGEVDCQLLGSRVLISGSAIKYLEGTIEI